MRASPNRSSLKMWLFVTLAASSHLLFTSTSAFAPPTTPTSSLSSYRNQRQQQQQQQNKWMPTISPLQKIQKTSPLTLTSGDDSSQEEDDDGKSGPNILEKIAAMFSTSASVSISKKYDKEISPFANSKLSFQVLTLIRVGIPSILIGVGAFLAFPSMSLFLCSLWNDAGVFAVLSQDSSQFVQNFLTVAGLLFSILVGQTYYFMYQQQEMVYYALFQEVTEAKSLLEQVALVCQGRAMYPKCLKSIHNYVENDLKKLHADPALLLSTRPVDDPLESIMYLTSVGVPSTVYETVRSLRQARAQRLGALQRKLPSVHMLLLWILAALELVSFPLLGAGTQTIGGYNVLTVEGCLFGVMTFGIVLTLRVVSELWRPAGGAYNVDNVLKVMVRGLEKELQARMDGNAIQSKSNYPSPAIDAEFLKQANDQIAGSNSVIKQSSTIQQQGADISIPIRRIVKWVRNRRSRD